MDRPVDPDAVISILASHIASLFVRIAMLEADAAQSEAEIARLQVLPRPPQAM